jgi:predicted GIY-YIG superfamily endonuclease
MPCKNCKCAGHNSRTCPLLKPPIDAIETVGVADDSIIPIVHVSRKPNKKYYCYIVKQVNGNRDLTYVGYTVKPDRRIRQHNGVIQGGAVYTSSQNRGPWEFLVVMTCPSWDNIRAMQTEWLIKHPARKRKVLKCFKGAKGRINSLIEVFKRVPEEEKIEMYVHTDYYNQAVNINLPENVNIRSKLDF